jgi:hypothetical protein
MDPIDQPAPNAQFSADEAAILANLKPEGAEPGTPPDFVQPADGSKDEPASSPAPAAPAASPAPTEAPAASPAPTTAPASAPAATAPPSGDVRKALRAARHEELRLREENERLQKELEDARAGRSTEGTGVKELTAEELAEMDENFPAQAQMYRETRRLTKELEELKAARTPTPAHGQFVPPSYAPEVQVVIDEVPALLEWQHDPNASRLERQDRCRALHRGRAPRASRDRSRTQHRSSPQRPRQSGGRRAGVRTDHDRRLPRRSTCQCSPA